MSRFIPVGQKRLTNICVVRYKRFGKRFEVACYKNTVIAWRNKVETDIDEVLQVHTIFADVDRGVLAKREDLIEAFGTDEEDHICVEILNKGEFQVSEQERQMQLDGIVKDVASRVTDMCLNPETQLPYPLATIERCMRETLHFAPNTNRSAKQQALQVVRQLQTSAAIPIMRAQMHLRLMLPTAKVEKAQQALHALGGEGEGGERLQLLEESGALGEAHAESTGVDCLADPGLYRTIADVASANGGTLQVVALKAQVDGAEKAASRRLLDEPVARPRTGLTLAPPSEPASRSPAVEAGKMASADAGTATTRKGGRDSADAAVRRAERMFKLNLRNAEGGDPVAQLEVGRAYLRGNGIEADNEQAREWLQKAAQQGVNAAKEHLQAPV
mmetsp:Transcript_8400/g.14134  ORF Transcript_8400/g.14134 Transcript_8400/m.14134 type:complete len:388 (+) Transcript_8400:155-1318(+)|eukprot:CAMPEP_0119329936 /NCGR_PEP_ID=MMETSP1333-20130426/77088_1 /TAXON_ID=418940 /ORGANISM="Scyphosphaera apsteinii, Strain RCC1455" /LENGTH=387 /DNA_ID=CAMNT_0007339189 /DNA_START=131 /DNA_END=1294 /DNA_ORIENTATION=-